MSRYKGWLTGSGKAISRSGSAKSGVSAVLDSLTGVSVKTFIAQDDEGREIVRLRIEKRGQTIFSKGFVENDHGDLVALDGIQ